MRTDEQERADAVASGHSVTAHIRRDAELIRWASTRGLTARIDRATKWGNPYPIGDGMTRSDVIAAYRQHLAAHPELLASVAELRGKVLMCWCYPQPCHGDVLIDALQRATTAQERR